MRQDELNSNENDEALREEYKPLHVPAYFNSADSKQDQVIYALGHLGSATAEDIILELAKHHSTVDPVPYLRVLFDKRLIYGNKVNGVMLYNLRKITSLNSGKA